MAIDPGNVGFHSVTDSEIGSLPGDASWNTTYIGPAFSGSDVRVLVLPTYKAHSGIFNIDPIFQINRVSDKALYNSEDIRTALMRTSITNLAGVSISTHRDKTPVYALGRMNPVGTVGSRRTTAGTLIFWLTDSSPVSSLISPAYRRYLFHADELPPFDMYLSFINDQGAWASCVIQGITITDEGVVIEQEGSNGIPVSYTYRALSSTPITPGYFSIINYMRNQGALDKASVIYQSGTVRGTRS